MNTAIVQDIGAMLRLDVGVVFALSTVPKLHRPVLFARSVVSYQVLPAWIAFPAGLVLIPTQGMIAVALVAGWETSAALAVASSLLAMFVVAVAVSLRRGRQVPCGCFGDYTETVSTRVLARLLIVLAAAVLAAMIQIDGSLGTEVLLTGSAPVALRRSFGIALGACLLALAALGTLAIPEVRDLRRRAPKRLDISTVRERV